MSIQHEYGIWGGDDGEYVLDFVRALDVPGRWRPSTRCSATPTDRQRAILTELVDRVDATVVMSRSAGDLLDDRLRRRSRGSTSSRTACRTCRSSPSATVKPGLGLGGRDVILSFGLLGRARATSSRSMRCPTVVAANPERLLRHRRGDPPGPAPREGEAYRESLDRPGQGARRRRPRPLRRSVRRPGRTDPLARGRRRLRHAVPEPRPDRVGHAVLRDGRRPGDRLDAVRLRGRAPRRRTRHPRRTRLADRASRRRSTASSATTSCARAIGRRAYEHSRGMVWSEVGAEYRRLFERVAAPASAVVRSAPAGGHQCLRPLRLARRSRR